MLDQVAVGSLCDILCKEIHDQMRERLLILEKQYQVRINDLLTHKNNIRLAVTQFHDAQIRKIQQIRDKCNTQNNVNTQLQTNSVQPISSTQVGNPVTTQVIMTSPTSASTNNPTIGNCNYNSKNKTTATVTQADMNGGWNMKTCNNGQLQQTACASGDVGGIHVESGIQTNGYAAHGLMMNGGQLQQDFCAQLQKKWEQAERANELYRQHVKYIYV